MTNFVTGMIGFTLVATFLAIMLFYVPALPLIIIVVLVMGLLLIDFWQSLRSGNGS